MRKGSRMARIPVVDTEECISCGVCVEECPEVFRMSNNDKSEVYNPTGGTPQTIQAAIDACPVSCISWD